MSESPEIWSEDRSDLRSQKSGLATKSPIWQPKCRNPEILGNPGNPGFRRNLDFSGKVPISAKSWIPGSDRISDIPHKPCVPVARCRFYVCILLSETASDIICTARSNVHSHIDTHHSCQRQTHDMHQSCTFCSILRNRAL